MVWDPRLYLGFANERTRPAAELLARVPLERPAHVIDLGCGPGNSTALLAKRWPDTMLEGLDSSSEMLAEAAKSGLKARWIEADVSMWSAQKPYDLIFSNATLQWVPDHTRLLPRLISFLAADGVFAFQVPDNFGEPSHALLRELSNEQRWKNKLNRVRDWHSLLTADAYYSLLEPLVRRLDVWDTEYLQVLDGDDPVYRWVSGTGARPYINALEGEERAVFIAEYKTRLAVAYRKRASGRTLFPFRRRFVIAQR